MLKINNKYLDMLNWGPNAWGKSPSWVTKNSQLKIFGLTPLHMQKL